MLGGDVHDSWAWTLYEDGFGGGEPVAVNLVCPGVGSRGLGSAFGAILGSAIEALGGISEYRKVIESGFKAQNTGLEYGDITYRGFFAAEMNHATQVTEYFHFDDDVSQLDYAQAREASGGITAEHICGRSLISYADQQGSLDTSGDGSCQTITFDTSRPSLWSIPVPLSDEDDDGNTAFSGCGYEACLVNFEELGEEP